MPRELWGKFETEEIDDGQNKANTDTEKMMPVGVKRAKLVEIQACPPMLKHKHVTLKMQSPLITQTIEVMKQTEMLQSLIDTYSQKSGSSNYLLNPCQMIPEIDFPPENAANFVNDDKFPKPIWFIPPLKTDFSEGLPRQYPRLNSTVCRAVFRKAICGQLRVAGFTDAADTALVLYADAIDEFLRGLLRCLRDVHDNTPELELEKDVRIVSLEKAYISLTSCSLTQMHNFRKHQLLTRNRSEIAEFKSVLQEYAKLMRESQSMQKEDHFADVDILNILEMPPNSAEQTNTDQPSTSAEAALSEIACSSGASGVGSENILSLFDNSTKHQQSSGSGNGVSFKEFLHTLNRTDMNSGGRQTSDTNQTSTTS